MRKGKMGMKTEMNFEEKTKALLAYLEERKEAVLAEVDALAAEERVDESNVLKAKANIYDIAKAVYGTAQQKGEEAATKATFTTTFGNITGQWKKALEVAQEHADYRKVAIEEAKQAAVDEIQAKFVELF